ncbi:MAG: hypothetical protein M4579_001493 [Chaenotheca gracillima]|nr:MAG: hypothetical protein M4579_001493 [Chaenotheca gracillima]
MLTVAETFKLAPIEPENRRDRSLSAHGIDRQWGMPPITAYTPLETLLVFQSLAKYGTEPSSFSRISEVLKGNPLIRDARTFDNGRLSPDALRELYLGLLNEEGRQEQNFNKKAGEPKDNGPGAPASKKRKLQSPPLPPVRDGSQKPQSLSELASRLYVRYQQYMIRDIREDERKYQSLRREIEAVERGDWDEQLQRQSPAPFADSREPGAATQSGPSFERGGIRSPNGAFLQPSSSEPSRSPRSLGVKEDADAAGPVDPRNGSQSPSRNSPFTTTSYISGDPDSKSADIGAATPAHLAPKAHASDRRASPFNRNYTASPLAQTSFVAGSPKASQPTPPSEGKSDSQQLPPSQRLANLAASSNAPTNKVPLPKGPPMLPGSSSGSPAPMGDGQGIQRKDNISPSPGALPSSVGVPPSSASPAATPYQAISGQSGRKYRGPYASPLPGDRTTPSSTPQVPSNVFPPPGSAVGPDRSAMDRASKPVGTPPGSMQSTPYSGQYLQQKFDQSSLPTTLQGQSQDQHGQSLPASNVPTPVGVDSSKRAPHGFPEQRSQGTPYRSDNFAPILPRTGLPASQDRQRREIPSAGPSNPQTPIAGTPSRPSGHRPPPLETSTSATRWKRTSKPPAVQPPGSPERPPHSPLSDPGELSPPVSKSTRGTRARARGGTPTKAPAETEDNTTEQMTTRSGRRPSIADIKTRGGTASAASSARLGSKLRTRSQSVASHADEASVDNDAPGSLKIKNEPPPTPAGIQGDDDTEMDDESATNEGLRSSGRLKRAFMDDQDNRKPKRKRSTRGTPDTIDTGMEGIEDGLLAPTEPRSILTTRNFSRTTAPLLNDIAAHKFAGLFSGPVRERDAPGYKDIIYRPQNIKSIKSAIAAGSRAVAAASSENVGTPGESGVAAPSPAGAAANSTPSKTNVTMRLPPHPDIVPPKAIVNSEQLEKELTRMFANAVMFNPDPKRGYEHVLHKRKDDGADEYAKKTLPNGTDDDEGAVINETREMFGSVEKSITDWRAAEQQGPEASVLHARGSVSKGKTGGREGEEDDADELAEGGAEAAGELERSGASLRRSRG